MGALKCNIIRLIAVTMAFVMVMALTGCQQDPPVMQEETYTVCVVNKAGTPLEKCKIEVYTDNTKSSGIYTGVTDDEGKISFTAGACDNYVAVVSRQPNGYSVEECYALAGEKTTIILSPGVMTEEDMDTVKYSLGDAVMDFSVSTPDGKVLTLSGLLQEKKAVVLNFWYLNCTPCKMEFPYIQEGYEKISEDVAVLALNPYDGTDDEVAAFQADNGYTFTMAKCDSRWEQIMKVPSYPTTVVIDRYGNICLIHSGMITETQTFLDMVGYFITDDYEQAFFRSVGQIPSAS